MNSHDSTRPAFIFVNQHWFYPGENFLYIEGPKLQKVSMSIYPQRPETVNILKEAVPESGSAPVPQREIKKDIEIVVTDSASSETDMD